MFFNCIYQSLFKAIGRYEFEAEFRRWIDKKFIDRKFTKATNQIEDIEIHSELVMYLSKELQAKRQRPKFRWIEHMSNDSVVLEVAFL